MDSKVDFWYFDAVSPLLQQHENILCWNLAKLSEIVLKRENIIFAEWGIIMAIFKIMW